MIPIKNRSGSNNLPPDWFLTSSDLNPSILEVFYSLVYFSKASAILASFSSPE